MEGYSEDVVFQMGITAVMAEFADRPSCSESELQEVVKRFVDNFKGIHHARVRARLYRYLETQINVELTEPIVLDGRDTCFWLTPEHDALFQAGYWGRYADSLVSKRGKNSILDIDRDTSAILTRCGDPRSEKAFQKKGLVIGDVQSGKTGNYTGLLCKAVDAGYKIVIVVAGTLNNLRKQTQERLEWDFTGEPTNPNVKDAMTVVAFNRGRMLRKPRALTSYLHDFDKNAVQQQSPDFESGDVILLVIKKNTKTLQYVHTFFKERVAASVKRDFPVLLIDDEADNASINSKKQGQTPTAINAGIRKLLGLFHKTSYVGYTATPYANIFINPDISGDPEAIEKRMDQQDLFPKDFIYCLMRPDNYFGAARLFDSDSEDDDDSSHMVQSIPEEDYFLAALKDGTLRELPESLVRALYTFVLTIAIKARRGMGLTHTSMLINVSQKIRDHHAIAKLVEDAIRDLEAALGYINLNGCEKRTPLLALLYDVWVEQFEQYGVEDTWGDMCQELGQDRRLDCIKIHVQNSKTAKDEQLDYSKSKSQCVILVGGNSLSRGLTLEGLTTSYFLRNSRQYDTLMQMGRWFGYRPGYEDLCRVFMTEGMKNNFAAISRATDELKDSIREMNKWNMTPLDFGLRVRNGVSGLIVTAPNKMRSAAKMRELVDFSDQMVETYCISSEKKVMESNCRALMDFLALLDSKYERWTGDDVSNGWIWENVSSADVKHYIQSSKDMWASLYVDDYPLMQELDRLGRIDVCFVSRDSNKRGEPLMVNGSAVYPFTRLPYKDTGTVFRFKKNRFFSKSDEMGHISKEELARLKASRGKALSGKDYRKVKGRRPLLIVAFARVPDTETIERCREEKIKFSKLDISQFTRLIAAYGLSFPFDPDATRKCATWVCNKVFEKELFTNVDEEGDDDDDEND